MVGQTCSSNVNFFIGNNRGNIPHQSYPIPGLHSHVSRIERTYFPPFYRNQPLLFILMNNIVAIPAVYCHPPAAGYITDNLVPGHGITTLG